MYVRPPAYGWMPVFIALFAFEAQTYVCLLQIQAYVLSSHCQSVVVFMFEMFEFFSVKRWKTVQFCYTKHQHSWYSACHIKYSNIIMRETTWDFASVFLFCFTASFDRRFLCQSDLVVDHFFVKVELCVFCATNIIN